MRSSKAPAKKKPAPAPDPATENQIATLKKFGAPFERTITKAEASELIGRLIDESKRPKPATEKQKAYLMRRGIHINAGLTAIEASRRIDELIANDPEALSMADVVSYDPQGGGGKSRWRRYCCPFCRKTISPEHRDFAVNLDAGVYKCHACQAKGLLREFRDQPPSAPKQRARAKPSPEPREQSAFDVIPLIVLKATLDQYDRNYLYQFLASEFGPAAAEKASRRYLMGTTNRQTIFWQVDRQGKVRTGKALTYDPETGKRVRAVSAGWIHARMIDAGELPESFRLKQCFFGEHLLQNLSATATLSIVESEKTAVIASICRSRSNWLASGGKQNLNPEKLESLGRRRIVLYPDADAYDEWSRLADKAREAGLEVTVSDEIERQATARERKQKIDLADLLIKANRQKA
jgi:hypothetical protein